MIPGAESVIAELWSLLAVVTVVYIMRMVSRRILLGSFKKYYYDDYLMTFAWLCYVIVIFSIYVQCLWGNNYVTPEDVVDWTPKDFELAIKGAEWGVGMETLKITCVWCCKFCLLILYGQMTKGLPQYHRAVYIVTVYVAIGYIIVMFCFFLAWCKPFHAYYDIIPLPEDQSECMTYRKHMLMDAAWNITSDALMLCLPIPLVIKAKVPLKRKLVLVAVFSLGALVILCAILNRVTNFTAPYGSLVYLNWYAGEASTAVMVANVPHLWPLISRVFGLGAFKQSTGPNSSNQYPLRSHRSGMAMPSARGRSTKHDVNGYIPTSSEERIAISGDKDSQWGYTKKEGSGDSSDGDLETGKNFMTTSVHGGNVHGVPMPVTDERLGGWETESPGVDAGKDGQIMKTVHINQYASDP